MGLMSGIPQNLAKFCQMWPNLADLGYLVEIWQKLANLAKFAEFGRIWQILAEFGKLWQNLGLEIKGTGGGEGRTEKKKEKKEKFPHVQKHKPSALSGPLPKNETCDGQPD